MKDKNWYENWKKEVKKQGNELHEAMHKDPVKYSDIIRTKKHLEEIIELRFRTIISQMARDMASELVGEKEGRLDRFVSQST